jgi:hypothetical protein
MNEKNRKDSKIVLPFHLIHKKIKRFRFILAYFLKAYLSNIINKTTKNLLSNNNYTTISICH